MSPNFDTPKKEKEETLEESIERARKAFEKANGVPQIVEADLFGGETLDETKSTIEEKGTTGIAGSQRGSEPNKRKIKSDGTGKKTGPIGTSWVGRVGDELDEAERRRDERL